MTWEYGCRENRRSFWSLWARVRYAVRRGDVEVWAVKYIGTPLQWLGTLIATLGFMLVEVGDRMGDQ